MSVPFASYIFTLSLENSNCLSTNKDYSAGKSTLIWQLNRINVHSEPTKRASFETTRCIYGGQKKKRRKGTYATIALNMKITHLKMSYFKRDVLKGPFSSLWTSQVNICLFWPLRTRHLSSYRVFQSLLKTWKDLYQSTQDNNC